MQQQPTYSYQDSKNKDLVAISSVTMGFNKFRFMQKHINLLRRAITPTDYIRITNVYTRKLEDLIPSAEPEIEEYFECLIDGREFIFRPISRFNKSCVIIWEGNIKKYPFGLYRYNLKNGTVVYRDIREGRWISAKTVAGEGPPSFSKTTRPAFVSQPSIGFTPFKVKMERWFDIIIDRSPRELIDFVIEQKTPKWSVSFYYAVKNPKYKGISSWGEVCFKKKNVIENYQNK